VRDGEDVDVSALNRLGQHVDAEIVVLAEQLFNVQVVPAQRVGLGQSEMVSEDKIELIYLQGVAQRFRDKCNDTDQISEFFSDPGRICG
jgi:hypothetical protein